MEVPNSPAVPPYRSENDSASSGVSWGAVAAAAFVGAALALILLLLGSGLGFSAISPWSAEGITAKTVGVAAIAWLIFTHLASSAITGYMAGRLRVKWSNVHSDEVYFRDTAHGLAAWAVGIVVTAAFLSSAATLFLGGATKAAVTATGDAATVGVAEGAGSGAGDAQKRAATNAHAYFVDSLFRSDRPREANNQPVREEVARIFARGLQQGDLSAPDRSYLTQVIAARTGLPQADAEKRVTEVMNQAKEADLLRSSWIAGHPAGRAASAHNTSAAASAFG